MRTDKNTENQNTKRRSTFAILFYINRTKVRKDGMCQLLCKVSIDAKWEQIGTKVSVNPSIWNPDKGRADLFPFGIYAYLAQQLTCSVFTDFGTVYIKQYRKCTATFDFHIISISFHNPIFCHYQITTENLSAIFLSNAFVSVSILLSVTFA